MAKFVKGQSGNPFGRKGRPKGPQDSPLLDEEMRKAIRKEYGKDAKKLRDVLGEIAMDPETSNRERLVAVKELLDRGWGRVPQKGELEVKQPESVFVLPSAPSLKPFVAEEDEPVGLPN